MATTQIHSNVDLNGHLTIAQNVQEFPADPQMGQIIQKGGVLYTYGDTGSGVISWLPMSIRRTTYVHQQFLPSAEWIVNHNLNTTDYGLLIYDADHNVVVAPNEPIDSNSVRVTLTTPNSGTAILIAVTDFSATSLTSASLILGSSVVTVVDGKLLVDGVAVSDSARIDEHIAALDPHSQYLLKSGGILTGALSFAAGQEWPTFNQSTTGNAGTATKLETARLINGVSFNGTADITINAVDSTAREPAIITGTTTQYWRGDKSWQTLDKAAVGLGNVDNTSDANKPISAATQQALDGKEASGTAATAMSAHTSAADPHDQYLPKTGGTMSGPINFAPAQTWPTFNQSTTGNAGTATKLANPRTINGVSFDGSGNITINAVDSTAREPSITTGSTAQYWRGDKSWQFLTKAAVGLGNVDNTSDLNKPISTATQTALNGKEASGTAATAMSAHTSAVDPHSQYLPKTDGVASGLTLNDGYTEEVFDVTGTTPALSPNNGSIQTWTLTANSYPTAGSWVDGQSITLGVTAGSFTVTWPSVMWSKVGGSGTAPTLTTTGINWIVLWRTGGVLRGAFLGTT